MKPSQFYEFTVEPFGAYNLTVTGDYFKIMRSTGPVSIKAEWGELKELTAGQGLEEAAFGRLEIRNETGSPNVVRIFVGDRKFIDGMAGVVTVGMNTVARAAFASSAKTVTNADGPLVAASASRNYVLIQNKHATASVFIAFGTAATVAGGIRIGPGGAYETGQVAPTSAIRAIGDEPTNSAVVVVEA